MKLYNMNLSNFATKCRIAIYDKGALVEIVPVPSNDSHSPQYRKIYPFGKVPCLDADGMIIGESETINEYLEEKCPTPALLPKSPEARARVRSFTRFHDLYLEPPLRTLFGQMNPKTRDANLVKEKAAEFASRLDELEGKLADSGYAAGADFTLADCALAPTLFFAVNLMPRFGLTPMEERPKLSAYWSHVQTRPSVKKGLGEMGEALAALSRR
jgi:glutathione S-transferase